VAERRLHLTVDQASQTSQVRVLSCPPGIFKVETWRVSFRFSMFQASSLDFSSTTISHGLAPLASSSAVERPTVNRVRAGSSPASSAKVVRRDARQSQAWLCGPVRSGRPTVSRESEGSNPFRAANTTVQNVRTVIPVRRDERSRDSKNTVLDATLESSFPKEHPMRRSKRTDPGPRPSATGFTR
jgi:hypothetical protein